MMVCFRQEGLRRLATWIGAYREGVRRYPIISALPLHIWVIVTLHVHVKFNQNTRVNTIQHKYGCEICIEITYIASDIV